MKLGTAAGLVGAVGALSGCGGSNTPGPQQVQPLQSDLVAQSYGVQIHASYRSSVYSAYDAVTRLLQDLGVRSVRDRLALAVPESIDYLAHLGTLGIKTHLTVNGSGASLAPPIYSLGPHLDSMAGDNEPNGSGRQANWASTTAQDQQWLWSVGQRVGVTVCSPPLQQSAPSLAQDYVALARAGVGKNCDAVAIHNYPHGRSPSTGIDVAVGLVRNEFGLDVPVYCTEGGYFTAAKYTGAAQPVSESAQAVYGPRQLLEYVSRGMRFWQYELLDDPDPSQANQESHFGMVAVSSTDPATWRRKPVFATMQALLQQTADPGPAHTPQPITLTVEGPDDLRYIVLGRRSGSMSVICWRDIDVYDPVQGAAIQISAQTASFTVKGAPARKANLTGTAVVLPLRGV